jgi:hypothetical protein
MYVCFKGLRSLPMLGLRETGSNVLQEDMPNHLVA